MSRAGATSCYSLPVGYATLTVLFSGFFLGGRTLVLLGVTWRFILSFTELRMGGFWIGVKGKNV